METTFRESGIRITGKANWLRLNNMILDVPPNLRSNFARGIFDSRDMRQISRMCPEQRAPVVSSIQNAARATTRTAIGLIPPEDICSIT